MFGVGGWNERLPPLLSIRCDVAACQSGIAMRHNGLYLGQSLREAHSGSVNIFHYSSLLIKVTPTERALRIRAVLIGPTLRKSEWEEAEQLHITSAAPRHQVGKCSSQPGRHAAVEAVSLLNAARAAISTASSVAPALESAACQDIDTELLVFCAAPIPGLGDALLLRTTARYYGRGSSTAHSCPRPSHARSDTQSIRHIALQPRLAAHSAQWRLRLSEAASVLARAIPPIRFPGSYHAHNI
jgi:hypothetical protein